MILNKNLSIILSVCFFALAMLLASSLIMIAVPGGTLPFAGVILIVVFYFITRAFYTYLRNDDFYKNNRNYKSDKKGEKYITKGARDNKKIFIIVWVIVILALAAVSMWLVLINKGLI